MAKKPNLDKTKGALMVVIDGKTRNVIMSQSQFQVIIEMLYILNKGIIQVSDQDFNSLVVTDLPVEMPPVVRSKKI